MFRLNLSLRLKVINLKLFSTEAASTMPKVANLPKDIKPKDAEKKPRHTATKLKFEEKFNIHIALDVMKKHAWAKFDETVELAVRLGVDPRKANQSVKGVAVLPHGNGKQVRIAVFAAETDAQAALDAGAHVVGGEDLIDKIKNGEINFDRAIATPEMMPLVSKIGKILGPRGLMPNPKMGTVTKDVTKAVKLAKQGSIQFRVDKFGIIHCGIGKLSFNNIMLLDNIKAFMSGIQEARPEGYKGKYLIGVSLSSTMGPGVPIDLQNVDPSNPKFMLHPSKI